ncbi:phosphate ABC transporter permease subunit PstC [Antrihabitans spumae]|uniref:Phosphate transport system permease protein n=1 Tax=Antrihabitans spumae TaxID=3373370 RepID=A0ABW7JGC6_9NOCA
MSDAPPQPRTMPSVAEATSAATVTAKQGKEPPVPPVKSGKTVVRPGDRIFSGLAVGSGTFIVFLIGAVAFFLLWRAIPSLRNNEENFLTFRGSWETDNTAAMHFGILDLLQVTVFVSIIALIIAMPIALGIAIFLTEYSPKRLAAPLAYVIDLLAAVPSIVYGLWGIYVLAPAIAPVALWLNENLSWIPIFAYGDIDVRAGGTIFTGGIVLAVMILPIIAAVTREVFMQTPRTNIEAALALGATRWEMVRTTIIPFGKSGYISGSMLGLGRALGETIALLLILSSTPGFFGWSVFDSGKTFATQIASSAPEFNNNLEAGAYIAAGLVLFVLTFIVNSFARAIIAGKKA